MKPNHLILLLLLLSLGIPFGFSQTIPQDTIFSISGQIYSEKSLSPIPLATLSIVRTKKGSICDSSGVFHLQVQQFDTLRISALGFETKEWPVPLITNTEFPPFLRISLKNKSYLLEEIDIYALGTWDQFKEDFLKTQIKDKNPINKTIWKQLAPYNTKKPNLVPAQYRPKIDRKLTVIDAIFKPTDFLYNKLSKTEKIKKRLSKRIRNQSKNKKIREKYNAKVVSDATGLKGDQLIAFMDFIGTKIKVNANSREYDVMKQILDFYKEYTTTKE